MGGIILDPFSGQDIFLPFTSPANWTTSLGQGQSPGDALKDSQVPGRQEAANTNSALTAAMGGGRSFEPGAAGQCVCVCMYVCVCMCVYAHVHAHLGL